MIFHRTRDRVPACLDRLDHRCSARARTRSAFSMRFRPHLSGALSAKARTRPFWYCAPATTGNAGSMLMPSPRYTPVVKERRREPVPVPGDVRLTSQEGRAGAVGEDLDDGHRARFFVSFADRSRPMSLPGGSIASPGW